METPEFCHGGYCDNRFTADKRHSDTKNGDHFLIEDLLDFPNDDGMVTDDATFDTTTTGPSIIGGASIDSSTVTAADTSCNSSFSGGSNEPLLLADTNNIGCRNLPDGQFSSELCLPYDDLAELEWLSNFVEESFSSDDLQKLQLISGVKARTEEASGVVHHQHFQPEEANRAPAASHIFRPEMAVPAKARSKRSRAAPCNWTSRLLVVASSPTANNHHTPTGGDNTGSITAASSSPGVTPPTMSLSSSSESDIASACAAGNNNKKIFKASIKKRENHHDMAGMGNGGGGGEGRKCLHCGTDKTPQWRTGPMGPKTLCNACGVRFKSGRLVPEYRPAASPTFVLTKHSNSHRKVLEIRRQKEMQRAHQHHQQFLQQGMTFDASNGDDYLIHQHIGPDFRQLI